MTATGGIVTITDSGLVDELDTEPPTPLSGSASDDVIVPWVYALQMDRPGDYVEKPMPDCTGKEILTELCYHLGLIDQLEDGIAATRVRSAPMPYITAQLMPRASGDRPWAVPEGSTNLLSWPVCRNPQRRGVHSGRALPARLHRRLQPAGR